MASPVAIGGMQSGPALTETDPRFVLSLQSTTYIQQRARDSNPDVLADAGFQVG
jgi:hypothetical protein